MTGYRPDIDGLRAVAVMPVICFHAGLSGFSGGYVGVDVFFVISGYLITSILLGDFARGRYSIASFYERRARRILPALLTVLAFCLVAGYLVMPPFLYSEMAWGVAAVALFSSNVLFWQKSGYFEEPTDLNPLIHTWSLGVEEQFYIGFPILLWFLVRRGERVTGYTLLVLCAVSFVAAEIASRYWPSANFYLLPFRGWELAIGSLLALWQRRADPQVEVPGRAPVLAQGAGVAGLGLIAIAVHTFDAATPFPGVYALLPVIGTALLIWSGITRPWSRRSRISPITK